MQKGKYLHYCTYISANKLPIEYDYDLDDKNHFEKLIKKKV